jgi:hypothetical protein
LVKEKTKLQASIDTFIKDVQARADKLKGELQRKNDNNPANDTKNDKPGNDKSADDTKNKPGNDTKSGNDKPASDTHDEKNVAGGE